MRSAWQASTTDVSGVWSQSLNHSVWQGAFFYIKNVYKKTGLKCVFLLPPSYCNIPTTLSQMPHTDKLHMFNIYVMTYFCLI